MHFNIYEWPCQFSGSVLYWINPGAPRLAGANGGGGEPGQSRVTFQITFPWKENAGVLTFCPRRGGEESFNVELIAGFHDANEFTGEISLQETLQPRLFARSRY